MSEPYQGSWWKRIFGRSILSLLVGSFFEKKTNAASLIALLLTITVCYLVAVKEKYEYANYLWNVIFVVVGYYFGIKQEPVAKDDE